MSLLLLAGCLTGAELEGAWLALEDPEALPACDASAAGAVSSGQFFDVACVPTGETVLGSAAGAVGGEEDEALHRVSVSSFWMGVTELTVAQYEAITGSLAPGGGGCAECPADNLDWHTAALTANAVSEQLLLPACYACADGTCSLAPAYASPAQCAGYRLPTEAEWEYAAGASERGAVAGSEGALVAAEGCTGLEALDEETTLASLAWFCGNAEGASQPVGGLTPNSWSLHDMSGNAQEWVADGYAAEAPGGDDPFTADAEQGVVRGGGCLDEPAGLRIADRAPDSRTAREDCVGVRLARTSGG